MATIWVVCARTPLNAARLKSVAKTKAINALLNLLKWTFETGQASRCVADMHNGAAGCCPGQDELGGAREACGWWRLCSEGASCVTSSRSDLWANTIARLGGVRAGKPLGAARHASQLLPCCGVEGVCSPKPSVAQMTASGSKPTLGYGCKA